MRRISFVLLMGLLLPLAALPACNTVEGVGEDMQSGGRAVERTADRAK